jgi:hypothetical protein
MSSFACVMGVLLLCGRRIWSAVIRGVAMARWAVGRVVFEGLLAGSPREKEPMKHRLRKAPWSRGIILLAILLCRPGHDGLRGWVGCLSPLAGWVSSRLVPPPLTKAIPGGLHCQRCVVLEGPRLACVP